MMDHPMIFSAPMVRALLDGRKSQTRRVLTPRGVRFFTHPVSGDRWECDTGGGPMPATLGYEHIPYAVGDRMWTREAIYYGVDGANWYFDADRAGIGLAGYAAVRHFKRLKAPPMFLPRVASRLTLIVTDVRVQRLQDISEEDAIAEGVRHQPGGFWTGADGMSGTSPKAAYALLWNSLYGDFAWFDNPWVVALTFTVARGNIDVEVTA